ncbi:hypothetical protein ACE3MS_31385, partial [Paenibacillus dendritiformis]
KGQGGARTVYATHHPAWDAKNRHGLPDEFPLDYSYIAHIFNGSAKAPATTPPLEVDHGWSMQTPDGGRVNTTPSQVYGQPSHPPAQQQAGGQITGGQPLPEEQQPSVEDALNPNIPRSLRDLMVQHQVQEYEIQIVVSQKGYYPVDTPITNYDPGFVEGVLVGAWPQVFNMIQEARNQIPFN